MLHGGGKKGGERMVTFTPDRSTPLSINGSTIELHEGVKATVPPEYKALYDTSR